MNAVETILDASTSLMTMRQIQQATGLDESTVRSQLRELAGEGQIEHIPGHGHSAGRYGLLRPTGSPAAQAAPHPALGKKAGSEASGQAAPEGFAVATETPEPESGQTPNDDGSGGNVWLSPEMQYLAPEDYELPPADPALLASANRMLQARLDAVAHVLRGSGFPWLEEVSGSEDLHPLVAALAGAYQMAAAERDAIRADYNSTGDILGEITGDFDSPLELWQLAQEAQTKINGLILELATERQAREALQEQINAQADDPAVDVKDAARGYLVRAPKRRPRIVTKAETAVAAAMAAARNGSGRGDVFALVPIGSARRGAEWKEA